MVRFAVLLAGPVAPTPALRHALNGRRVIAADGGIRHAEPLGLKPELWIGDFDSSPGGVSATFSGFEREVLPREKDRTDGEAAVEAALARGARDLLLVGALRGPRSDHAFSNLVLALRYRAAGLSIELFDGCERALPLGPAPCRIACEAGTPFSILRFSDVAGLTVRGAKWPLEGADLPFHSILTQSNEALGPLEVSVETGEAMLLVQARP
ncbi:thiamine diphosphokinase [Aureimonas populi]|uniref:Thiamine diphosphokinase n=1 Tax=Aureimonas populi TaxID=1701758 RepID=A0ABW5CL49_9HYPH|nr:thiamine diphosphokinase [Aureimonas populi]